MRPRSLFILLLTLVSMGVTARLGLWQLDRAREKQVLNETIEQQARHMPLQTQDLLGPAPTWQAWMQRRVHLRGRWLPEGTVYLDNRQLHGRPGYFVMTPLLLDGSQQLLVVQRGWVPRNFMDRTQLPPVDTPLGLVTLEGRIAPAPSKLYALGPEQQGLIRQNLDLVTLSQQLQRPVLPVSVWQLGPDGEGLSRQWPLAQAGVEKHHGYAFQWFGLSGLIVLLYVWFQIAQPYFRRAAR